MPIKQYKDMWECDTKKAVEKYGELVTILSKYDKQLKLVFGSHDYQRIKELVEWMKN